jgi:two-component system, sensor histidine kinase and response regulator
MTAFSSVLLIEDNPGDARLVTEYLGEHFGDECEVRGARTLAAGLEALRTHPVDLVLLDLSLPDSTGLESFYQVHATAPHTPVVILTGDDDDALATEALRVGAEDYLAKKHADSVALIRTMRHAVQRRHTTHASQSGQAQLEARVAERTAQLQAANAELEAFNHSVAHDLRAPLNAILGFAAILQEDAADTLSSTHQRHLQFIERSAQGMNDLIGGLLSMAKVARQDLAAEPLDLSAMAAAIAEQLTQEQPLRHIAWHIEAGLRALGDPTLVNLVLKNLLHNAWKYSSCVAQPQISVGTAALASPVPVYFVRDNGVGFDMASADKLFMPFQRLPSAQAFEGTGLGLATVRRIVERHGGHIWAESEPSVHTTFFFSLEPNQT